MSARQDIQNLFDDGEITLLRHMDNNTDVIGYRNKTFCVTFIKESPLIDGVLCPDRVKDYKMTLENFSGAYAIIWDPDDFLRFINGIDGNYLTPQNYDNYTWTNFN